jgi:hypothetical protein
MNICESNGFIVNDRSVGDVTGPSPLLCRLIDTDAHEGPVYFRVEDALCFTSVPTETDIPAPHSRKVAIRRLHLDGTSFPRSVTDVSTVREAAIGMAVHNRGQPLICEQGSHFEKGGDNPFRSTHKLCGDAGGSMARPLHTARTSIYRIRLNIPGIRPQ